MENISAYCLTEGKLFLCTNKHKVDEKIYWNFAYQIILEKKKLGLYANLHWMLPIITHCFLFLLIFHSQANKSEVDPWLLQACHYQQTVKEYKPSAMLEFSSCESAFKKNPTYNNYGIHKIPEGNAYSHKKALTALFFL